MQLRLPLYRVYWKLEKLLVPGFRTSLQSYEEALNAHVTPGCDWLEVGCGHQILAPWRAQEERQLVETAGRVIGIDFDLASLRQHPHLRHRIRGDINRLPFANGSFDLVTANMVVEHLTNPKTFFQDVQRVLRPGGTFIVRTPNRSGYTTAVARLLPDFAKRKLAWLLEGRNEEDVFPAFYRANTKKDIQDLAAQGFELCQLDMVLTTAAFAMVPPLALLELLWIRLLTRPRFADLRPNMIAVLRRRG